MDVKLRAELLALRNLAVGNRVKLEALFDSVDTSSEMRSVNGQTDFLLRLGELEAEHDLPPYSTMKLRIAHEKMLNLLSSVERDCVRLSDEIDDILRRNE